MQEKSKKDVIIFIMIDLTGIRNIIFDLGGVLLNLDEELTNAAFARLSDDTVDNIYHYLNEQDIFAKFETDQISPADFRRQLRKFLPAEVEDKQIDHAWNAMLLDLPTHRLHLLSELKQSYYLFLLSNTNKIHYEHYCSNLKTTLGVDNLLSYFNKEYFSPAIKLRKPDEEVFHYLIRDQQLSAEQTLFIDDNMMNIHAARKVGLKTHYLERGEEICDKFPT